MDVKYPKISKQWVTQHSFCANINHQKILRFLRHRKTYAKITWAQKDMKMTPKRGGEGGGLSEKRIYCVVIDCQSNTKTITVLLSAGLSGDLVVKSKLFPRNDPVVDL